MICRYKIKFISDIEQKIRKLLVNIAVAPFVGVWIEITTFLASYFPERVAPFVGVWIEISFCRLVGTQALSLPSWECGLKFAEQYLKGYENVVAPFVGVWIEICEILS